MALSTNERLEIERLILSVMDRFAGTPPAIPGLRNLGMGDNDAAPGGSFVAATRSFSPPQQQVPVQLGLEEVRALLPHPGLPAPSLGLEEARALLPHPRASESGLSLPEVRALLPHAPPTAPPPDDAQVVLASRIFG